MYVMPCWLAAATIFLSREIAPVLAYSPAYDLRVFAAYITSSHFILSFSLYALEPRLSTDQPSLQGTISVFSGRGKNREKKKNISMGEHGSRL